MNLGLMACGDDDGTIWLYSLPDFLLETDSNSNLPSKLLPIGRLPWPHLQLDGEVQEGNVIIDKVVFSPDGNNIVAITNNNIVAFWKKGQAPASV